MMIRTQCIGMLRDQFHERLKDHITFGGGGIMYGRPNSNSTIRTITITIGMVMMITIIEYGNIGRGRRGILIMSFTPSCILNPKG
jgi:hypothetical protein